MAVAPPDGENAGETGRAYSIASREKLRFS